MMNDQQLGALRADNAARYFAKHGKQGTMCVHCRGTGIDDDPGTELRKRDNAVPDMPSFCYTCGGGGFEINVVEWIDGLAPEEIARLRAQGSSMLLAGYDLRVALRALGEVILDAAPWLRRYFKPVTGKAQQ